MLSLRPHDQETNKIGTNYTTMRIPADTSFLALELCDSQAHVQQFSSRNFYGILSYNASKFCMDSRLLKSITKYTILQSTLFCRSSNLYFPVF